MGCESLAQDASDSRHGYTLGVRKSCTCYRAVTPKTAIGSDRLDTVCPDVYVYACIASSQATQFDTVCHKSVPDRRYCPVCAFWLIFPWALMIDNLLVARDFSTASDRALHAAFAWARPMGTTVHLLAIQVTNDNPFEPAEQRSGPLERLREQLKDRTHSDMAQSGYDPGSVSVKHEVQRGEAAGPAIVRYAERAPVDLIMMGTTGRRGVRRAMLGSVAEEVVRTAPCPVCTVRATAEGEPPDIPEHVVIPIDFSEPSREALAYGLRLAQQMEADVAVVHAIEEPSAPLVYGIETGIETKRLSAEALKHRVYRALGEWIEQATTGLDDPPSIDMQAHTGAPASVICETASTPRDLVVMATEGRTGMERMVLGSVAESVLRNAVGPVVTARSFAAVQ